MSRWPLVLAGLLLLVACGEETGDADGVRGSDVDPLDGRTLVVTGVTEGGTPRPIAVGTQIRLSFAEGQLGIQAGCNSMSAATSSRVTGSRLAGWRAPTWAAPSR